MGKTKLNIIVSCVANKSIPIPSDLEFRNIELNSVPKMADQWINKLKSTTSPLVEANQLYSGAAWNTILSAKEIADNLQNYEVEWYIMSVGYGLIKWVQPIKPYSITFSKPSFDGLRKRVLKQVANREWWNYITTKRRLKISDITNNDSTTIILGSTEYINAIREDLSKSTNFMIFSSTYNASYFVDKHVQTHEKLRFITGGGKVDNNARNLKFVLEHLDKWGDNLNNINTNLSEIISGIKQELPKVNRNRKPISDKEAKQVILEIGLDKPMAHYINKIRNEMNRKISEQVIIGYIQELK
mgnify:FL=1|jgi:cytoplasmic iron level regulating protein YaaA (DUF328/UPF0246 family)|tara:strand:- start:184 stop:1083 length:900 start_codon:yes stop_codon:yes gene_type:complete